MLVLGGVAVSYERGTPVGYGLWFRVQAVREMPSTQEGSCRNVKRFRGGLVFKAHRLVHYSTLGLRVIKKSRKKVECNRQLICAESDVRDLANRGDFIEKEFQFKTLMQ